MQVICQGCKKTFPAKSAQAKWCSQTCRTRTKRAERREASRPPEVEPPLVTKTREELERAGRLDTFSGELAMVLATRLAAGASSPSSLSKELRTVMAAAMEGTIPPSGTEDLPDQPDRPDDQPQVQEPPVVEDDLVAKARREREIARQAAA